MVLWAWDPQTLVPRFVSVEKRQTGRRQPRPTFKSFLCLQDDKGVSESRTTAFATIISIAWRQLTIFGEKREDTDEDRAHRIIPKNNFVFFVTALKIIRSRAAKNLDAMLFMLFLHPLLCKHGPTRVKARSLSFRRTLSHKV